MATLTDYKATGTAKSLKRGVITPQLGAKEATPTKLVTERPGAVQQFVNKASALGEQFGNITLDAGIATGKFIANTPRYVKEDVTPFLQGVARTVTGELGRDLSNINKLEGELQRRTDTLTEQYRSGSMSKENYQESLKSIRDEYSNLNKEAQTTATKADRGDVVESAAMTAFDIFTFSQLEVAQVGGKQLLQVGTRESARALIQQGATTLERQVLRMPVVRSLIERNLISSAKRLASESLAQYVRREGVHIATGLLIKRPIFYQSNLGNAKEIYNGILEGNSPKVLRNSAWLGIQMIEGGPLGVFFKGKDWLKGSLSSLSYGKGSFIDELSARIGDGNRSQIARFLTTAQDKAPNEFKKIERAFRIFQESNLRVTDDNVGDAVANFLRTYTDGGADLSQVTASQLYKDMDNWLQADDAWNAASKAGKLKMTVEEAARFTPVRWDAATRSAVADAVVGAGDSFQDQWKAVQALGDRPGVGWSNNKNLMDQIQAIFNKGGSKEEIARAIRSIDAAAMTPKYIPKDVANRLAKLGYTVAEPVGGRVVPTLELDDTRKLISGAIKGTGDLFDEAVSPQPQMAAVADFFEKAGISPRASNTYATRELGRSVAANLDQTSAGAHFGFSGGGDKATGGQAMLSKLQQYIENKKGLPLVSRLSSGKSAVTDIRQLRIGEIEDALGHVENGRWVKLGNQEAKEVYKAIAQGYVDVPLELRGLGERVVDGLYKVNPLQKYYSRIQSAFRYTYSPFFRLQERVETGILSRTQSDGLHLLWSATRAEQDDFMRVLDEGRIFSGVLPGEAAQDQVLGRITANITKGQKRDLAGLALDIMESKGFGRIANHADRLAAFNKFVQKSPDEIDDILRVVVQYPKKGGLASPLARTINLMFFPMRYNAKVSLLAAQALAKQAPNIQKAVLHSGFRVREWLKSDEGIRWQSKNADAIQLMKWLTPINSIESTMKLLTGSINGVGDIGLLGGLPLGFITQVLDGQGIIDINKPYVDPKTGNVFPDYIPQTAKARAATALGDVINTLFTYPGRVMGLPGKEATVRNLVKSIIATEGKDFEKRLDMEKLTPLQQNWVRVLQGDTSKEAIDALYISPAPGQFSWYTIPPLDLPIRTSAQSVEVKRRTGLPKKAKGKKSKKTALPIPTR